LAKCDLKCGARSTDIYKSTALGVTGSVRLLRCQIDIMDDSLSVQNTVGCSTGTGHKSHFGEERCVALWDASQRDSHVAIPFEHPQATKGCFTKMHRFFEHCLEHGRKDARRRIDGLQHLRRCCLLLQRIAQLVEQPRVLDRDDGLAGEAFDEFDLLLSEW